MCPPPEQGFFSLLGSAGPVQAHVREGESLSLRVEFEAYPGPSSWSWSYDGKQLLNTTEHVITVHHHKYRQVDQSARRPGGRGRGRGRGRGQPSHPAFDPSGTWAPSDSCGSSAAKAGSISSRPITRTPPLSTSSTCSSTVSGESARGGVPPDQRRAPVSVVMSEPPLRQARDRDPGGAPGRAGALRRGGLPAPQDHLVLLRAAPHPVGNRPALIWAFDLGYGCSSFDLFIAHL